MKLLHLCGLLASLATFALADAGDVAKDAKALLESTTKRTLEVISYEKLEGTGLYMLIVRDKVNGYKTLLLSDEKQKNLSVVSGFFSEDKSLGKRVESQLQTIRQDNLKVQNSAKLNALFSSIPKDYTITITGATTKRLYIVSDPMCSHCQEELAHIESKLKTHTIIMIPVGLLGTESLEKSAEIYDKIRTATTPKAQIDILRSIYSQAHKAGKTSNEAQSLAARVTNMIKMSGLIEGVPFIYEPLGL